MSHYHPCDDKRCEPFGVHVNPDAASAWQAAIRVVESSTADSSNPTYKRGLDAYHRALLAGLRIAAKRAGVPVPSEPPREQVDPTSLGIDDLTDAERDAFVALAEHREETP